MSDLVQRLSTGEHTVELSLRPTRTLDVLKDCLERGYVHVKFTGTRGGTELGVAIDPQQSDFTAADLEAGRGRFRVVGGLTLDYVKVRCVADIDVASLEGRGRLEVLEPASQ